MLTFPEVFTHRDTVVFPDDEDPNLYYALAGVPRLRMDQGKPVFRGLFWTDAADGAAGAVAGVRGAQLNFDVNMALTGQEEADLLNRIRDSGVQQQRAEQIAAAEKERLTRLARVRGQDPNSVTVRTPDIRPPRLGSIQYLSGNVVLLERQTGGFIEWSSAGGPPSLIGSNNAAFSLRLNAEGAAVWFRALEQDATAISIRYELKFQARLPSLQIHVWAGSHQALELERKVKRTVENRDQGCSDADVENIDVDAISEKLTEEGLINIEIIKGSAKISDEHVSQLRNAALNLISDRIKQVITSRIRGLTEEERKRSLVSKVTEEVTSFAELRLTQRDVIEWGANPQATITGFLGGLDSSKRKQLITLVDLSDPIVSTLEVPVSVDAPWAGDPKITRVRVRVDYPGGGDNARTELLFDSTKTSTTVRWRRPPRDRGLVHYRAEAFIEGVANSVEVAKGESNGAVFIQVPQLGKFAFKVRAHPDTFTGTGSAAISGVQFDYTYKAEGARDRVAGSAVIRKDDLTGVTVAHKTGMPVDAPVILRPTYLRANAAAVTGTERTVWVRSGEETLVELPSPWPDALRISARCAANIPGLLRAVVQIQHKDPASGFESDAEISLDKDGEWEGKTNVVQANRANQRFRYRYLLHTADQIAVCPWTDAEGDQEVILPVLAVTLRFDRLKLGQQFSEALVRLRYDYPGRRDSVSQEFFLTPETRNAVWLIPRTDPSHDAYKMALTLFRADGTDVQVAEADKRGSNLILVPPA